MIPFWSYAAGGAFLGLCWLFDRARTKWANANRVVDHGKEWARGK
jgi:hypothetical protein